MIDKIGTGLTGASLIRAELNEYEKTALADILLLAEMKSEELQTTRHPLRVDGKRGQGVQIMTSELRRIFEIED